MPHQVWARLHFCGIKSDQRPKEGRLGTISVGSLTVPIQSKNLNRRDEESDRSTQALLNELRILVDELALTEQVVTAILPNGRPHEFESALWDYKEKLPVLPPQPTEEHKRQYRADVGDIIKDVVAFHNCYGGYIVFGVADRGSQRVRGCATQFDCGDFNRRLENYTGCNIECLYRTMPASRVLNAQHVGVPLIPRRPTGAPPVRFIKKGPDKRNGTRCFNDETYIRIRDECRAAAATSADWQLLHSDRSPSAKAGRSKPPSVKVQLPARDLDLVAFVGREAPLSTLRTWLTDLRNPVRLITGIGGLGKTTLAYRFAEEVSQTAAGNIEWIIWLTAKQQTFSALRGQFVAASKVDFTSLASLYGALLGALSHEMPPEEEEPTLNQIADRVVEALTSYSCLIIVDDIDSLSPEQQKETVAALNAIALRTVGREIAPSRVLMTSRIDQGMPPTAVIKISGFEHDEFAIHVLNLCRTFKVKEIKSKEPLIPNPIDQNPWAHWRSPMDMMRQG
jgi:AAA domain/Putative DNA-binding domain